MIRHKQFRDRIARPIRRPPDEITRPDPPLVATASKNQRADSLALARELRAGPTPIVTGKSNWPQLAPRRQVATPRLRWFCRLHDRPDRYRLELAPAEDPVEDAIGKICYKHVDSIRIVVRPIVFNHAFDESRIRVPEILHKRLHEEMNRRFRCGGSPEECEDRRLSMGTWLPTGGSGQPDEAQPVGGKNLQH